MRQKVLLPIFILSFSTNAAEFSAASKDIKTPRNFASEYILKTVEELDRLRLIENRIKTSKSTACGNAAHGHMGCFASLAQPRDVFPVAFTSLFLKTLSTFKRIDKNLGMPANQADIEFSKHAISALKQAGKDRLFAHQCKCTESDGVSKESLSLHKKMEVDLHNKTLERTKVILKKLLKRAAARASNLTTSREIETLMQDIEGILPLEY